MNICLNTIRIQTLSVSSEDSNSLVTLMGAYKECNIHLEGRAQRVGFSGTGNRVRTIWVRNTKVLSIQSMVYKSEYRAQMNPDPEDCSVLFYDGNLLLICKNIISHDQCKTSLYVFF